MATKSAKTIQTNRAEEVKKTVKDLNKKAVKMTDDFVEESLAAGEQWQVVFAKAVKSGTVLLDKQSDIMFDTLEDVKAHLLRGNKRFRKLFSIDYAERKLAKYKKVASAKVAETASDAKARVEKLAEKLEDLAEDTLDNVKAATDVIPTPGKIEEHKIAMKKESKKAGVKKSGSAKSNLQTIDGIGPKLESILNKGGIVTLEQLAKAKPAAVKEILAEAGPRYKKHDPTVWINAAKTSLK